ncbi:MAG TPA: phosphoethanolamine transferase CptA [Pseudomonadales bacterium]|nr:phosphoethanolamine transferase CptA [Pseudomonadales bacterium]HNI37022.1 phosphoethanolamine transferase CptA [Pseudomonadales bacterium]
MYSALTFYLFFAWFSVAPQLLVLATGNTGWSGPRDAMLYSLTWLLLPALLPRRSWAPVFGALGIAMGICALMKVGYFLMFQQEMSQSVFVAILESPPEESKEFMQQFFRWWMLPTGIAFILPALWAYRRSMKTAPIRANARYIYIALACVLIIKPFIPDGFNQDTRNRLGDKFSTTEPWATTQSYISYLQNLRESDRLQSNMEAVAKNATIHSTDATDAQTYVLVIGESTNRNRLSLYGYPRDTNPRLQEIRHELLVYNDVVANIPYTIESLSSTLTFTPPEKYNEAYRAMNVVTMMKKAGFKTFWITNQQTLTHRNTMLTAFAKLTDEPTFLNNNRRQSANSYDEVVLKPFADALSDNAKRKLIVVHLIGTHFAYEYRYPDVFNIFSNQQPLSSFATGEEPVQMYNDYDNAVRYNDNVVRQLIDSYRAKDPYGFLLYFADHGEEVFDVRDFNGRDMSKPTIDMYDVPFIVWPAPRWAAQHDMKALENTVHRPSSLSLFMNGWCTLAAIQYKECNSADSIFSADFVAKPRWVGILKARQSYEALNEHDRKILTEQRATAAQKTTAQR